MRGAAFLALGLALVAGAFVVRDRALVVPGVLVAVLPLVAWVATFLRSPGLVATRRVTPAQVEAGRRLTVQVDLAAQRAGVAGELRLDDRLPASFGGTQTLTVHGVSRSAGARVRYECRPRRRGRFRLDHLAAEHVDLLGLVRRRLLLPAPTAVLVTPPALPLRSTRQQAAGTSGETPIPQTAISGPDDVLVREYQPLDDVRRVHWPSTARAGQLMVRREEQAWDPTAWVILDSRSASHGGAEATSASFEWLVTLAASIGARLLDDGYVVSLTDADASTHSSRGREHLQPRQAWLEHLVDAALTREDSLGPAARMVSRETSGHVVVALLGSLTADDAASLVDTADARHGRAVLLDRELTDEAAASRRAGLRILAAHGWSVVSARADGDPVAAWDAVRVGDAAGAGVAS